MSTCRVPCADRNNFLVSVSDSFLLEKYIPVHYLSVASANSAFQRVWDELKEVGQQCVLTTKASLERYFSSFRFSNYQFLPLPAELCN